MNKLISLNAILFLMILFFGVFPWYMLILTIAQLLYVPFILHLVLEKESRFRNYYFVIGIPAFASVAILNMTDHTSWDGILAAVYFLYTMLIALYGFHRFLHRGFTNLEEFSINMGLMYITIGGAWFFAFEAGITTGFSPLITSLTAIHFHYSAFLLPIFVGFLGRLYKTKLYHLVTIIMLVSPIIVALGITFSVWLEVLSVLIYIVGIYCLMVLISKTSFHNLLQKWLVGISFGSIAVTILFSLSYALGNLVGNSFVTIDFMLKFHGIINSIFFGLIGIMAWWIHTPNSKERPKRFPVSRIRGKWKIGESVLEGKMVSGYEHRYSGLVDSMKMYEPDINVDTLAPSVIDFYENTNEYQLFAEVKWRIWFKPFAALYRQISRNVQQINLPVSNERLEMTGDIYSIDDELDGRKNVRAWMRKVKDDVTFVALYSSHFNNEQSRTYMNIALPLPWAAMVGILELSQQGKALRLSSKREMNPNADSGVFLTFRKYLFKLPLEEQFDVKEVREGVMEAQHRMWIFTLPFLEINYKIHRRV
ncbi:YndJ family protein [Rossellomorea sp. BNER]|uniref:YndJ family protein n=1 Tax=Rossellomorea sp. BNER TaxID=2962031 RepID=UPI003AF2504B|nr:YndJ family protein [Rossellomorea sp. BNER]